MESEKPESSNYNFEKIVDIIIRLGALLFLFAWCFDIVKPFILLIVWAGVITIALYPLYTFVVKLFRGRRILASVALTLLMLSLLIVPTVLLMGSLYDGIQHIREAFKEGQHLIPPPGAATANWPDVAKPIIDFWQLASDNLQAAVLKYPDQIKTGGEWFLTALAGIGMGVAQFVVSLIIAGVLLVYYDSITVVSKKLLTKLGGKTGEGFGPIAVATILNVFKGVLGVAVIQATMVGIAFYIAGVPFVGLWIVLCLILAIVQLGVGPVAIPITIYMFSVLTTGQATILAIWIGICLISDNVLKPILLGRGAPAPMLVVFLGSIGGFMFNGFLGLFLGAVVLTIGYKIFTAWLEADSKS